MGRHHRRRMSRRREAQVRAQVDDLPAFKRLLERIRAWTHGDDGTLRDRAGRAEPGEGLVLHVGLCNDIPDELAPQVRPYWKNVPLNAVIWGSIAWARGEEWAEGVGMPWPVWRAFAADVEFLSEHFGETMVASAVVNKVIHAKHGQVGGVTTGVHRAGVHDVWATPGARQAASPRWRRRVIAESYCDWAPVWHGMFEARDPRDGLGALVSWVEPGDLIAEPLVVSFGPRPYFLHVESEREYGQRMGKSWRDVALAAPQLIPDLPVLLRDGAPPPPWAIPGGQIDIGVHNRWEVAADADYTGFLQGV
jgi:hypothetical protein